MSDRDERAFLEAMRALGVKRSDGVPVDFTEEDLIFEQAMGDAEPTAPPAAEPTIEAKAPAPKDPRLIAEDMLFERAMAKMEAGADTAAADAEAEAALVRGLGDEEAPRLHGTPRSLRKRIKKGEITADAELDLHGLKVGEADEAVRAFLRTSVQEHRDVVRVICGRGLRSRGEAVLKAELDRWLRRDLRGLVREAFTAPPEHGGEGAYYVFLRRFHGG